MLVVSSSRQSEESNAYERANGAGIQGPPRVSAQGGRGAGAPRLK